MVSHQNFKCNVVLLLVGRLLVRVRRLELLELEDNFNQSSWVAELNGITDEVDEKLLVPISIAKDFFEEMLFRWIHDKFAADILLASQELKSVETVLDGFF